MDDDGGMSMGGMGAGDSSSGPLNATGVDFSDPDQASDFLEKLLDDTELQIIGNAYARYFWYGVVVIIGFAAVFSLARREVLRARLRAAAQQEKAPSRPRIALMRCFATLTALARESSYLQFTSTSRLSWFRVPTVGNVLLIASYFAFVLALEFINATEGGQYWQALGVRAGWLAVAQMPLLIMLIGKNNLIGLATGVSYERLNVFHRWSARIMLLLAIFHFGFQSRAWSMYGLMKLEWATDDCPITGIAAFAILLWINLSTLAPIRNWCYEFFVIQHIVTFIGFIVAIMYHLPSTALYSRVYIYIPIALYIIDRTVRAICVVALNARMNRATLTPLEGNVTKICVSARAIKSWNPGAHILISFPRFGIMQTHPATIASTPKSHNGDLVFILKGHRGFTRRLMTGANNSTTALLPHTEQDAQPGQHIEVVTYRCFLDGPYGGSQSDFAAFDSACLIAGSTGVTFTLAILQDLADRTIEKLLPLRRVHFVWCVKGVAWTSWVNEEIGAAVAKLRKAGIDVSVSVYVTCADGFTDQSAQQKECDCACDKSLGPCCCSVIAEDVDAREDTITPIESGEKAGGLSGKAADLRGKLTSSRSSLAADDAKVAIKFAILPCAEFYSGRPAIHDIVETTLDGAKGESAIAVCGPIGLSSSLRNIVVRLSDQRAIHKGTGAQGCYLHVESFS